MTAAYLLLGSNIGDRGRYLAKARQAIGHWAKTKVRRWSKIMETKPFGVTAQRLFLNQAIEIETNLAPVPLLIWAKKTEIEIGRRHYRRWGPREIDIDIMLYGCRIIRRPFFAVPHPALKSRLYALGPMAELCPRKIHPATGRTISEIWRKASHDN
ncbi:MAG: 2-amino-4-hydroxy-6-hydroxymethyldihydropteridine diphosphokinase [Elusimicrobia bacterium]|nr:2-amino-4-hydroxy-6-hydroxymethyldihydropteridine diphosphokinase [Elusimicrobiota bacterium]